MQFQDNTIQCSPNVYRQDSIKQSNQFKCSTRQNGTILTNYSQTRQYKAIQRFSNEIEDNTIRCNTPQPLTDRQGNSIYGNTTNLNAMQDKMIRYNALQLFTDNAV